MTPLSFYQKGVFACLFFLSACTMEEAPSSGKAETQIILKEFEQSPYHPGWEKGSYYTGPALKEIEDDTINNAYILDKLSVDQPGDYEVWLLGATSSYSATGQVDFQLSVSKDSAGLSQSEPVIISMKESRATQWNRNKGKISFPEAGEYYIKITKRSDPEGRIYLDQLLFTNKTAYMPEGYVYENDDHEIVLPPSWAFGILYGGYTNQEETTARVQRLVDEGYPIDAYWIDSWFWNYTNKGKGPEGYLNFVGDTVAYPDVASMWEHMDKYKIKSGIWIWDIIQKDGNEAAYEEFLTRGFYEGEPFENNDGWHNSKKNTLTLNLDFQNPEAVAYWHEKLRPFFENGLDFLKLDRSSDIPYLKAAFEATQNLGKDTEGRGFIMSHLHSTYEPEAKLYPTKWSGDAKITWDQPNAPDMGQYAMGGLKQNIEMVADPHRTTYENPFLTNDTGGYNFFGPKETNDTLYIRWVQFSMFNPITTVFSTADNPTSNMPYNFSPAARENFLKYARLKQQLFPYIYSYAHNTRETGEKMIQGDGEHITQYLFGKELLVAPIFENAVQREVFLPEGTWYDFHTDSILEGGRKVDFSAPLEIIPVFVRSGSIIPMRPTSALNIESGTNDTLQLHLYTGADGSFTLTEDDGNSNDYQYGKVAKTTYKMSARDNLILLDISARSGEFRGMNPKRSYEIIVHGKQQPVSVSLNEREISVVNNKESRTVHIYLEELDNTSAHQLKLTY